MTVVVGANQVDLELGLATWRERALREVFEEPTKPLAFRTEAD